MLCQTLKTVSCLTCCYYFLFDILSHQANEQSALAHSLVLCIGIINSQLKSLHTLFCIEVVRWSKCQRAESSLEGKMMGEKVKLQEVALFVIRQL